MKHHIKIKVTIGYIIAGTYGICFIYIFMGLSYLLFQVLFNFSLNNIGWFVIALIATSIFFKAIAKLVYPDNYKLQICHAYRWSIREAMRTQYPHGIVYILENILKELNKFNITKQPYKDHRSFQNGSSDYYGFPNQSNLSAIIVKAKYLCEEWSKLDQIQQIQCMEGLWNQIREEDMWLDDNKIKLNKSQMAQDIYWYSYEESDHKKMSDQSRDNKDLRNPNTNRSNNNIDESVW